VASVEAAGGGAGVRGVAVEVVRRELKQAGLENRAVERVMAVAGREDGAGGEQVAMRGLRGGVLAAVQQYPELLRVIQAVTEGREEHSASRCGLERMRVMGGSCSWMRDCCEWSAL